MRADYLQSIDCLGADMDVSTFVPWLKMFTGSGGDKAAAQKAEERRRQEELERAAAASRSTWRPRSAARSFWASAPGWRFGDEPLPRKHRLPGRCGRRAVRGGALQERGRARAEAGRRHRHARLFALAGHRHAQG